MNFQDIPKFPHANYSVHIPWMHLENYLKDLESDYDLDLDPEFQRDHVWTRKQKSAYIEWILKGGFSGKDIFFNCPCWLGGGLEGRMVLLDGKQRIDAVLKFLNNKVRAFGLKYKEFEGRLHSTGPHFVAHVNNLETDREVYEWYLSLNAGGTTHKKKDLDKVRNLLDNIEGK